MEKTKIFKNGTEERKALEAAALLLEAGTGRRYIVEDIYFDLSTGRKWTTIIEKGDMFDTEALNPREQEDIISGDIHKLADVVDAIVRKKNEE